MTIAESQEINRAVLGAMHAEREACARIVEARISGRNGDRIDEVLRAVAAKIRGRSTEV